MSKVSYGAYSQRFSNYTSETGNYHIVITSANNLSYGNVYIEETFPLSAETVVASQQGQQVYSNYTPAGGRKILDGTRIMVTAKPAEGYRFVGWSGNASRQPQSFTCVVDKDLTFVAQFEAVAPTYHSVRVRWNDAYGRVSCNGMIDGAVTVEDGDSITLKATPKAGCTFTGWSGLNLAGNVQSNRSQSITITVTRDLTLTANFAPEADAPAGSSSSEVFVSTESDSGINTGGSGSGSSVSGDVSGEAKQPVLSFLKKWWWAVLIAAVIIYIYKKGDSK